MTLQNGYVNIYINGKACKNARFYRKGGYMGEQVIKRSATEQVYTLLIKKIRKGEFAPGDRLNIENLSREFGVSRTPVREAISMLTQNGYLEQVYNSGPRVAKFDEHVLRDTIETNNILMEGIIPIIFRDTDIRGLSQELLKSVQRQEQAMEMGDQEAFAHNSIRFHEKIIAACSNKKLAALAEQVQKQLDAWVGFYQETEVMRQLSVEQHREIAGAFEEENQLKVKELMRIHNTLPMDFFKQDNLSMD